MKWLVLVIALGPVGCAMTPAERATYWARKCEEQIAPRYTQLQMRILAQTASAQRDQESAQNMKEMLAAIETCKRRNQ